MTLGYKRQERARRQIIEDGSFGKGMYYTNNLVDSATSRLLLNYTLRDNGAFMSPRMGISMTKNKEVRIVDRPYTSDSVMPGPHVKYYGMYRDMDGLDKFGNIVLSFGVPNNPSFKYYYTDKDNLPDNYYEQVYTNQNTAFGFIKDFDDKTHPIDMSLIGDTRLRFYDQTPKPLYTTMNNRLYVVDGKATASSGTQDYTVSGSFQRYSSFPYDGSFSRFTIVPVGSDVSGINVETFSSDGTRTGGINLPLDLKYLQANGVTDTFNYMTGIIREKVRKIISDTFLEGAELVTGTHINFLKILKPTDGVFSGTKAEVAYRTSNFGSTPEVNVNEVNVFDNLDNVNRYTVRISDTHIYVGVPNDLSLEDAMSLYESTVLRYELSQAEDFPLDKSDPLEIQKGGYITLTVPNLSFPISAEYTIVYKQPIVSYSGGLLEIKISKTADGFVATPSPIIAKEAPISEATSVGFNMLHSSPYAFQNKEGLVLRPQGIMPYVPNSANQISMSANIGEEIEFEVIYEYIKGTKYFAKWEYLGVGVGQTNLTPIVIQDYGTTPLTGGAAIKLVVKANDVRFSLRVTMAPVKDNKPDETLAKVITYPVYETGNAMLKDISSYKYDLHNATGLGSYRSMLVIWGVPGAETTLFFSDFDDASYFPFANNIVSFNHKILGIQNYQGGLLVFTTDSIYLIEGEDPVKFEITELYQNLKFDKEDMESLVVFKNTIFIRSGTSYYTLVPNTYTGQVSDIRLTNISAPVKELVGEWDEFLEFLGKEVFDWKLTFGKNTKIRQYDFFNYIDDTRIKNVYRFALYEQVGPNYYRYQIDVVLVYNTAKGTWTVETMNLPFNEVLADSGGLYSSYSKSYGKDQMKIFYQELDYKNSSRIDIYNTSRYGEAVNDDIVSPKESELQKLPEVVTDKVLYVIDGDTIVLENLGSFRFLYVNAPEYTTVHEPFGAEATAFMKELFPVGSDVRIEFEGDRSDKYDRVLGWIFNHEDVFAQLALANFGGVSSVYSYGAYKYAEVLDEAIDRAWRNKVGLWEYATGQPQYIYSSDTEGLEKNYQVLDTGNKNHDPYLQKRFREFQFQIINRSQDSLNFYNRFYVEAVPKQNFRSYEITYDTDRNSRDYGTIDVVPVDESNLEVTSATYLNTWKLGVNMFPDIDLMKVRFQISGKGRYGRMLFVSKNEANYDLLSYAWVLRVMNYK